MASAAQIASVAEWAAWPDCRLSLRESSVVFSLLSHLPDPSGRGRILLVRLLLEEDAMTTLTTTTMSSKGQVVIPEAVRNEMGLEAGAQFIVISEGDAVMLKRLSKPATDEFKALHERLRRKVRAAGLTRKDIAKTIAKVRKRT
jgi:AbrB family looped-hinge helix DNA binding protein